MTDEPGRSRGMNDEAPPGADPEHCGELGIVSFEGTRSLAHRDGDQWQLVQRDGADRSDLGEAQPDIGQDGDHERRNIEEQHDPAVENEIERCH